MKMYAISTIFLSITVFFGHGYRTEAIHRMPIHKVHKANQLSTSAAEHPNELIQKQHKHWQKKINPYNLTLLDFNDILYVTRISIGTPPQEFVVQLDTGSGLFWVVDSKCGTTGCYVGCADNGNLFCTQQCDANCCSAQSGKFKTETKLPTSCQHETKFNSNGSTSYRTTNKAFTVEYGFGFAAGSIGQDVVKLGPATDSTALTLPGTYFGQADQKDIQRTAFSGIFGLSYRLSGNKSDSVVVQAYRKGALVKPLFSIYLATEGNVHGKPGGVFTLGDADQENCGKIVDWIDIISNKLGHWKIGIEDIKLDNKNNSLVNGENTTGIVDTGTSLMLGPYEQVIKIYVHYGVNLHDFSIPCDQNVGPITFLINGRNYEVTKDTLILRKDDNTCFLAIRGIATNSWVLGDPFCRKFCQIHDIEKQRVALPEAKKKN